MDQTDLIATGSGNGRNLGHVLEEQLDRLRRRSPDLYDCVDPARVSACDHLSVAAEPPRAVDFESSAQGGRGESYRRAQRNTLVRATGIQQLFDLVSPNHDRANLSPQYKILDVLGGDGVLTRALCDLMPSASMPSILTSDLSEGMVAAAQALGLPAIRQPAQRLVLKDNCFDGVIIAYGTHHIPRDQRLQACREAARVLRPGGRIVLHDFEEGSPAALWFNEVVERYSLTGHDYPHFTAEEIRQCLLGAGFVDVHVRYLYDPFVLTGDSPEHVEWRLSEYLLDMYGLVKLVNDQSYQRGLESVYALACKYFQYDYQHMGLDASFGAPRIQAYRRNGLWQIEMPRVALVGLAVNPHSSEKVA